ncbi:protein brown [Toxorhynchites rutilus septentrionalis]|uniref:protein brown n=1 Tax=Toxorhynchites rutilus septentrionalis TaxID=329112 RepID=UPI00247AEBC9|nr:protein brown [Toxorhynchites rutilus septentrionalis]
MTVNVEVAKAQHNESMVLLEWKSLTVSVQSYRLWKWPTKEPCEAQQILKDATGAVQSGDLVAVMGASGSGKTTLLAAVSMRMMADVTGSVLINGRIVSQTQMKRLSGFVPQFDIAISSLTVREHLTFVSKLKGVRLATTRRVIDELNLGKCEFTRISHLSGGERKKVNLAGELLTEPDMLFCDEPTTGLDSFSALSVMNTLRRLAVDCGKIVICTIHHPTSHIFECFTDIVLVKKGEIYYQGRTLESSAFFASINCPLPLNCNPGDHYFKLVCDYDQDDYSGDENRFNEQKIVRVSHIENIAKKCSTVEYGESVLTKILNSNFQNACWLTQLRLLLHRSLLDSIRNLREYVIVMVLFLASSITISALYFHITPTSQTAIQDIRGALFLMVCELLYTLGYTVFYVFPQELPLLRREVGERMYRLSAYYAHKALLTVPKAFFESFLYVGIVYACVQFSTGFATYIGIATVCSVAGLLAVAYGYLLSCLTGSMELSIEYANIIFLLYGLLGGLYLNIQAFPISKYFSFFFFASEGASVYYWRTVGNITCDQVGNTTCLADGYAVLEDYSYGTTLDTVYFNYLLLAAELLVVHFLAYLSLRRFVNGIGFY